ncbi:MAG: hypothetical protein WKG03_19445 [Telluria sp.]
MAVWGTKLVYRKLGYVADFCQICITARPFVLERIGMARHFLHISKGEGELIDYQRTCLHCSTAFRAEPQQYAAVAKNLDTIEPLMRETFPNLAQAHAARLALEQQVRDELSAIDQGTRSKLLLEPFTLLSPRVAKRFATAHFEIAHAYLRREIVPLLGQTLARLRPTAAELQTTLDELVHMRDLIGAKIKLPDLMADIDARLAGTLPEVGASPVQHYSSGGRPAYRRAALIFKVLGWFAVVVNVFTALVIFGELQNGRTSLGEFIGLVIFLCAVTASQFALHAGLERKKNWARIWAIVYAIAFLFAFPIGTVIGAYVIWCMTAAWET